MERIAYKDFIDGLLENGKVVPGSLFSDYFDSGFYSLAACESDIELVRERLVSGGGSVIELNGVNYSITYALVSDRRFNVTGFTGDGLFGDTLVDSIKRDISLLQVSASSFLDMSINVSSGYGHEYPIEPYQAARRIFEFWYRKSIDHIKQHLAYNLLDSDHELFAYQDGDVFWSQVLSHKQFFELFKDFESLDALPKMLDFKRLLSHIVSEFNEDEFNQAAMRKAAEELASAYVNKTTHKAFDKYKLRYYSTWHSERSCAAKYKEWTDALGVCCNEQGKGEFYDQFIRAFTDGAVPCSGDGASCGDVVVRKYKEHITLAIPKDISVAIGIFINKYAPDYLLELAS